MGDNFSVSPNYSFPPIYVLYSSPGFHFPLFFPAFILGILSAIGIILNSSVCYITWKYWGKYTTFKSKTSVLIAINSFLEVVHQAGHFVFLYVTATGINFIRASLAFKLEGLSIIITNCVCFMLLNLSIDRVLAVAFPLFYLKLNFRLYIYLHILSIVLFFIFDISTLIISIIEYPDWLVTGYIGDLLISVPSPFNTSIVLLIPLMGSALAHIIVELLAKYKGDLADEKIRKLFRSISLIIIANIGGYVIFMIGINVFGSILTLSSPYFWHVNVYLSMILNVSAAINAPILYINSSDYKSAYKKEFGTIKTNLIKLTSYLFNLTHQTTTVVQQY